jgi:hypothetical protein
MIRVEQRETKEEFRICLETYGKGNRLTGMAWLFYSLCFSAVVGIELPDSCVVLYHLSCAPTPFAFSFQVGFHTFLPGTGFGDYRHVPPHLAYF